jgi:ATP-dependent Clp protease adaptor protein ClpS|tara:strand:- start:6433 stop:6747 length:315 start_codon:yes stop_codon:yes gene_type:complete
MIADEKMLPAVITDTETGLDKPKQYYVVMHNDATTPFDFVIEVLNQLFHHSIETASELANKIHIENNAIVGMYYQEIAEQKVEETTRAARSHAFTLTTTIEPTE